MTMIESKASSTHKSDLAYMVGVTAFIVVVTVRLSTTTSASHSVAVFVGSLAAVVVVACILLLSRLRDVSRRQLAVITVFSALVIWAVLASVLSQALYVVAEVMLVDIVVVGAGVLIFSRAREKVLPDGFSKVFVVYVACAVLLALFTDGIVQEFPPRFSFEYASNQYGNELAYEQGASNFYGLGAIAAAYWLMRGRGVVERLLATLLMTASAILSVMGGARGDTTIALLIILGYIIVQAPRKAALLIGVISLVLIASTTDWAWIEEVLFVQRMLSIVEGDYGYRDQLQAQVVELLAARPWCLISGCGVGYFQHFYGYEQGMYPHNVLLECLVIFGLPLTVAFIWLTLRGGLLYYRRVGEFDLFLLFTLYAVGVSMKSGSFFGSWLTLAQCLYLVSHCFVGRVRPNATARAAGCAGAAI